MPHSTSTQRLACISSRTDTPLVLVVERGAPDIPIKDVLPFISMFAVANSALINMMMAGLLLAIGLILSVPMYLMRRASGSDLEIKDPADIPPHKIP